MSIDNIESAFKTTSPDNSLSNALFQEVHRTWSQELVDSDAAPAMGEPYPYPQQTRFPPRGSADRDPYKYQDGNIYP